MASAFLFYVMFMTIEYKCLTSRRIVKNRNYLKVKFLELLENE